MRTRLALALGLLALAVPSSASGATTFGANLNRTADSPHTCGEFGFQSCSWESINFSTGESGFPPVGTGVVTRVRVKTMNVTQGPMQIVVEEALREKDPANPGRPAYICCTAINVSQVFTPSPGGITEVPVNLPVRQDASPDPRTGNYVDDHLALSVLSSSVPIPASSDSNASLSGWFPAWERGQQRTGPYGTSGFTILFNADWEPASNAPGTGCTAAARGGARKAQCPATSPTASLALASSVATVRGRFARVRLTCRLPVPCIGRVRLQSRSAGAQKRKRPRTYASGRFNIKAGATKTVRTKLKRAGRRLMRRRRSAKATARMTLGKGRTAAVFSGQVTLRRR